MKKRIVSTLVACALLIGCIFSFAGCVLAAGPITLLSGEYENELLGTSTKYEFSPLGKVTLEVDTVLGDVHYEGTYKVDGDEITFEFEESDTYSGTFDFSYGEEEGKSYVKIGILKYYEED